MGYTDGFKARMVRRMAGPEGISATALAKEVGVSQATLSRWLREARTVEPVGGGQNKPKGGAKSPRRWAPEEKLRVLLEASKLSGEELGGFLRAEGLHTAQLEEWRRLAIEGLAGAMPRKSPRKAPEARRVRQLEKELLRKDKALAEVTALLACRGSRSSGPSWSRSSGAAM